MALAYPPFKPCPCAAGRSYASCCQLAHTGQQLPSTPEILMRARYTAFALQDEAFVLATWHPDSRPPALDLSGGTRYTGLKIHAAAQQEVEFTVSMKGPDGRPHRLRERSRFALLAGRWVYVDGELLA